MPTNTKHFFNNKQTAAVLKHELLSRYLRIYVQKTASTSKDRRVAYVDCYAGPGTYEDGSKGSPAVALETAKIVTSAGNQIDGYFIEKERASADALQTYIAEQQSTWRVYNADVSNALPTILRDVDSATSMFVFLDPFGLGIPMDQLGEILKRSGELKSNYRVHGAPTEVLLNFSFSGLRRNAGHLTSTKTSATYERARSKIIEKLDATLGGDWWQAIWRNEPPERENEILSGYLERLGKLPGRWGLWSVPVGDRWDGPPSYSLIQLSQHPDGKWQFNEALSNALELYRTACIEQEGTFDFEPLPLREEQWTNEIKNNVVALLTKIDSFKVHEHMPDVFGDALGFAREKHLRKVLKELYKDGVTDFNGVGELQNAIVRKRIS